MTIQNSYFLVWILLSCDRQALADSCHVYPSDYTYLDSSITTTEKSSFNCRRYSPTATHVASIHSDDYTHCNGTQLRLTDSDFGSEQYSSSDYYVWKIKTKSQLLFIFPTRVNLTTITLHYYSDNVRGLPRLRFYAAPDDFNVWDAPHVSYSSVEVAAIPPGGEPAGRRNVSIAFNLYTTKILMYKYKRDFQFAVSEVEFFKCDEIFTTPATTSLRTYSTATGLPTNLLTIRRQYYVLTTDMELSQPDEDHYIIPLAAGVTATVLILVVITLILVVLLLLWHKRRNTKLKTNSNLDEQEAAYSMLDRGTKHFFQPQPLNASIELYDQIQLSPSTGQSEHISKSECENKYISLQDSHQMNKTCASETNYELLETETVNPGYLTYAVDDKKKKKSKKEESKQSQENTLESGYSHKNSESLTYADPHGSDKVEKREDQQSQRKENLEEMYAVVQKKPKKHGEEETAPPVPSYTVEALYTAVQKKPK